MIRYKTDTRPGLVAMYDIRPGNGAGQFLQPRSPHVPYELYDSGAYSPTLTWMKGPLTSLFVRFLLCRYQCTSETKSMATPVTTSTTVTTNLEGKG